LRWPGFWLALVRCGRLVLRRCSANWPPTATSQRDAATATPAAATTEDGDGTEGTTARTPPLHRQRNALEIERSNPTLEALPTNADQELPRCIAAGLGQLRTQFSNAEALGYGRMSLGDRQSCNRFRGSNAGGIGVYRPAASAKHPTLVRVPRMQGISKSTDMP
jgi:hypothetical protein